jgi:hypothetical protein
MTDTEQPKQGSIRVELDYRGSAEILLSRRPSTPERGVWKAPTFDEVIDLIVRGRELPFTTASPIQFRTAEGLLATITFDRPCPDGWPQVADSEQDRLRR